MLIYDDALLLCQRVSSDPGAEAESFFKQGLNLGYKDVLGKIGRSFSELTETTPTIASQQRYQLPPDYLTLKSATITIGSLVYPLRMIESQEQWNLLNISTVTSRTTHCFVRPVLGYAGDEIELFPIPSASDWTLTIVYEATAKDLTATAYSTGTAQANYYDQVIVGAGTAFSTAMIGRYFQSTTTTTDGMWYRIVGWVSAIRLKLENYYEGVTTNGTYKIASAFSLPEDIQMLPAWFALQLYYESKDNTAKSLKYKAYYDDGLKKAKVQYGNKTTTNRTRDARTLGLGASSYPAYFPSNIT